jgi:hypothetical protein
MICYVGAAQNEKQAQNALKKYNKWTAPDPANPTTEVVWNGAVAMISGCKLITGYQNGTNPISGGAIRMPVYHSLYWMNVLWPTPDDTLYNDVANVAHAPIIEFDFTLIGNKPSNFVRRSANLPAALVPIDTKILGITPVWGGSPNMGWLYDSAA